MNVTTNATETLTNTISSYRLPNLFWYNSGLPFLAFIIAGNSDVEIATGIKYQLSLRLTTIE
ncbi:hypothetical protein D3C81_2172080 [compost metagenome]